MTDSLTGGPLANPAVQFPKTFGHLAFFRENPYALPTLAAGAVCLTATLTSFFFLKETLPQAKPESGSSKPQPPKMSTWEILKAPGVGIVLYIFGHTMLLALAYTAVSPVFLFTDVSKGGLGFSDSQIAGFLAVAGASQAAWMLLAFPYLQRRFGTGNVLRGCAIIWPFMMASFPALNELRLRSSIPMVWFWILLAIGLVGGSGVSMAFGTFSSPIHPHTQLTMKQPASNSASTTSHLRRPY